MPEYMIHVKSNYFHVIDDDLFIEFINRVDVDNGTIDIQVSFDDYGIPIYGFTADGIIIGVADEYEGSDDQTSFGDEYDNFLVALQELVAEDDAVIIMESGMSADGDVFASATIVTTDDTEYIDLQEAASDKALEMLSRSKCAEVR